MTKYAEAAMHGNHVAGANIIRMLEDGDPDVINELKVIYPHAGNAHIIGITGAPGAGKSTLVDQIISAFRSRGLSVGVVAIDPSSPFTGGAVLGDRVRMQRHAADEGVFVRSMSTRGHLGGLSRVTREAIIVLDAMGFQVIIVETVGVGQDEVEVSDVAHSTTIVVQPGAGDDIQVLKAGLLETGDIFVVNKADKPGADALCKQLANMIDRKSYQEHEWRPLVLKTSALRNEGISKLADALQLHRRCLISTGTLEARTVKRDLHFFRELVRERAVEKVFTALVGSSKYKAVEESLKNRSIDPYSAAEQISLDLTVS